MNKKAHPIMMPHGVLLPGASKTIESLECRKRAYRDLNAFARSFPELRNRGMRVIKDIFGLPVVSDATGRIIFGNRYTIGHGYLAGIKHACKTFGIKLGVSNHRVIVSRLKLIGIDPKYR